MARFAFPTADLERELLAQLRADRRDRAWDRVQIRKAAGAGLTRRWTPRDLAAEERAKKSFGLVGGELCGCHETGCETCASNGGCGQKSCLRCRPYQWRPLTGRNKDAFRTAGAQKDRRAGQRQNFAQLIDPGLFDMAYDAHGHNFCYEQADADSYVNEATDWETTTSYAQVQYLVQLQTDGVLDKMVLMGSYSGGLSDPVDDTVSINAVTAKAYADHPDFFHPFYHVLTEDFDDSSTYESDMATRLADGWGLGELFVHGHFESYPTTSSTFIELCVAAADAGVPLSVHWEFGFTEYDLATDDRSGDTSGAENFAQLVELLDEVEAATSNPLTLILCHAGLGAPKEPYLGYDIFDYGLGIDWIHRVVYLLAYHPNVFFDLAGLQVGETPSTRATNFRLCDADGLVATKLGTALLDLISAFPHRFLFGTDIDNRYEDDTTSSWGTKTYSASVDRYRSFLDISDTTVLEEWQKALVMYTNLANLLA